MKWTIFCKNTFAVKKKKKKKKKIRSYVGYTAANTSIFNFFPPLYTNIYKRGRFAYDV